MIKIKSMRCFLIPLSSLMLSFVVNFISLNEAQGSPHPALTSSDLLSAERGLFLIPRGYMIKSAGTDFLPIESKTPETFRYAHRVAPETLLSITIDEISKPQSLESFAKRWTREYIQFGFKIRGTQQFNLNKNKALVIDLDHPQNKKSLRQVVLIEREKAAVITCTSPQELFSKTLGDCNKMISTFTWTSDPRFSK